MSGSADPCIRIALAIDAESVGDPYNKARPHMTLGPGPDPPAEVQLRAIE
jgi:hypothetical protein